MLYFYRVPKDDELLKRVLGVLIRFSPEMRRYYVAFMLCYKPEKEFISVTTACLWICNISLAFENLNDESSAFAVLQRAIMQVELLFGDAAYAWKKQVIDNIFDSYPIWFGEYVD